MDFKKNEDVVGFIKKVKKLRYLIMIGENSK